MKFRRPRRELPPRRFPPGERRPVKAHPMLVRANRLFQNGKYEESAALYLNFAKGAVDRNLPRAPILFLQAGKAYLIAEKTDDGMRAIWRGLKILADKNREQDLLQFGKRSVNILNELGLSEQANEVDEWLQKTLPNYNGDSGEIIDFSKKREEIVMFPTICPACGGRVHPDEVRKIDSKTLECSFCGSLIQTE